MSSIPRSYGPGVRKVLLPIGVVLLIAWAAVQWMEGDLPGWYQALAGAVWFVLVFSRAKVDADCGLLFRALAFSSQVSIAGIIALFIAVVVVAKEQLELDGSHMILFVMLFAIVGEGTYGYLRRASIGRYWALHLVPILLWVLVAIPMIGY